MDAIVEISFEVELNYRPRPQDLRKMQSSRYRKALIKWVELGRRCCDDCGRGPNEARFTYDGNTRLKNRPYDVFANKCDHCKKTERWLAKKMKLKATKDVTTKHGGSSRSPQRPKRTRAHTSNEAIE